MAIRLALAGNPNCGKTTMFNDLTGSSQYVGNWPGVTVEKKEGKLKGHKDVTIVDLPGIYSLSPYTMEEVITRNYLIEQKPDAIINIVDASNLERNLYLTTQLVEIGLPVVIALNMMDVVKKNGDHIDSKRLSEQLGCPVVEMSAVKSQGLQAAAEKALELAREGKKAEVSLRFSEKVRCALCKIEDLLKGQLPENTNWYAIKFFERDAKVLESARIDGKLYAPIEAIVRACEEDLDDDAESIITGERYAFIGAVVSACYKKKKAAALSTSDKIDRIVTNRWLALPIFALIMWAVYYISVTTIGSIATDWVNDVFIGEWIQGGVSNWLVSIGAAEWLQGLLVDGIIGGVGAVIGFVPQIMVLFLLISILEDCGYMARVAFIMDRLFRKFGLSGKSFIPMLIGSGCSVPAIMASRTMENDRDRKMTIMLTPFIPCSAKLPVFALMAGAFFPGNSFVAPSMYFLGILMVILCGILMKRTRFFKGDPAPFVMELPQYHMPRPKGVLIHMWERGKAFIVKAGTIIFVACGLIWFLQSFNWSLQWVDGDQSILASIGRFIAPIFAPLGFGSWQASVATATGFLAKENIVATLGVLFGLGAEMTEESPELIAQVGSIFATKYAAYAFMAFTLLASPCFAAIGAIRREMGSAKWTWITIAFQTGTAYIVALLINLLGPVIVPPLASMSTATLILSAVLAVALVAALSYLIRKRRVGVCGCDCGSCGSKTCNH